MDDQKIQCFLETAKTLSFTKSANALFMSQSAISRNIRALEDELELELFDRKSKNVVLTPAGKIMADGLLSLTEQFMQIHKEALLAQKGYSGEIRIGILQEFMLDAFPYVLNSFEQTHPHIRVTIVMEPLEIVRSHLLDNSVDFVLGGKEDLRIPEISTVLVGNRRIGMAVAESHPLADYKEALCISDFRNDTFVTLPESHAPARSNLLNRCKKAGFVPNVLTAPDIGTIMYWVELGRCVCILYENTSLIGNKHIRFKEMADIQPVQACICWIDSYSSPCKKEFIDFIRSYTWFTPSQIPD